MEYYLVHHGILGQKWGIRRFQNPDGTLTEDGIRRYRKARAIGRDLNRAERRLGKGKANEVKFRARMEGSYKGTNRYIKNKHNLASSKEIQAEGKKQVDELLKIAEQRGYTVNSKYVNRHYNFALPLVSNLLGVPLLSTASTYGAIGLNDSDAANYGNGQTRFVQRGKKYKVTEQ